MLDVLETVPAPDQEFFSDLAYDYYGKRIATCNSDHTITVWAKSGENGSWKASNTIQGRTSVFRRVAWAQPEFGQILAACSSDCNVVIFEETGDSVSGESTWVERARLVDSHGEVHALQFAPRHLGMQLATLGEDGIVRVYEAGDTMQLNAWPLRDEFAMAMKPSGPASPTHSSISCLAWNTSPFDPPQLVVARLDTVQIWQYSSAHRKWQQICDLSQANNSYISDVAWAPNLARSYDLIAMSFMSQDVVLAQVRPPGNITQTWTLPVRACRLSWNLAGTLLATSAPDGNVQVWGRDLEGNWECIESVRPA